MAGGRPPIYNSVQELEEAIQGYYDFIESNPDRKLTISGLAYHLGFASRQSVYDLQENQEFSYTIKRAVFRIEGHYEGLLQGNSVAGPIFALKNLGWKDKTEVDQNMSGNVHINFKKAIPTPDD